MFLYLEGTGFYVSLEWRAAIVDTALSLFSAWTFAFSKNVD
jgi:hypothetical protein